MVETNLVKYYKSVLNSLQEYFIFRLSILLTIVFSICLISKTTSLLKGLLYCLHWEILKHHVQGLLILQEITNRTVPERTPKPEDLTALVTYLRVRSHLIFCWWCVRMTFIAYTPPFLAVTSIGDTFRLARRPLTMKAVWNHWNGWEGHLNLTTKSTGRVNLWSGKNEQSWSFHGRFISNMICFIHRVVAKHWDFLASSKLRFVDSIQQQWDEHDVLGWYMGGWYAHIWRTFIWANLVKDSVDGAYGLWTTLYLNVDAKFHLHLLQLS